MAVVGDLMEAAANRTDTALVLPAGEAPAMLDLEELLTTRWQDAAEVAATVERFRELPSMAELPPPARLHPQPAPVSAAWPELAAASAQPRAGRFPGRRDGPGQDGADHRPHLYGTGRRPPGPPGAHRHAHQPGRQLAGRTGAVRAASDGRHLARPGAGGTAGPVGRHPRGADHLRRARPRRRADAGDPVAHDRPGRGTGDQKPGRQGHPRRLPARGTSPGVPVGHADREQSGRVVEPVRVPAAGPAGRPAELHQAVPLAHREGGRPAAPLPAEPPHPPVHPAPHQGGGGHRAAAEGDDPAAHQHGPGAAGAVRHHPRHPARQRARPA